ncbi:hypothetical protein SAMN05428967_2697 [Phyllobacterium sp. YR620]|uniref:Uncharacterized protein n=1 Tax=Phyllobacterium pellucidum TaxID=2740464 RepID=A0A849VJD1_9HYPH|nr:MULTISPECIES: hypothetical protein [Phyllobacterium]NTS29862.1 hypothetical protein [Phyllobacterium pellucidum]UGY08329.1 hypothetical protein LLE51_009675 [Phyllobacterium sp. T1018]SDP60325.1 hypothetical protein SAMN05428967_2697 [Phyllobacterium sp. YR620]SFJ09918.1 hypothetical protein SAMN04515648_2651 [Phyllobacterium sp. CL33Tsu]
MLITILLGLALTAGKVDKGDAVMQAQFDLLRLSYACGDPLYRSKRDSTRRWIERLESNTTYSMQDVADLDSGLKNGTIKPATRVERGDCIKLLADGEAKVESLVEEYNR